MRIQKKVLYLYSDNNNEVIILTLFIMTQFKLRISELKSEVITYCGYSIDDCYVFTFEDNALCYIQKDRLELYKLNGKLKNV